MYLILVLQLLSSDEMCSRIKVVAFDIAVLKFLKDAIGRFLTLSNDVTFQTFVECTANIFKYVPIGSSIKLKLTISVLRIYLMLPELMSLPSIPVSKLLFK